MRDLHVTLTADGPSDEVLLHPIRWLLRQHLNSEIALQWRWADPRSWGQKPKGVADRIRAALAYYPCDLLFVHRDAEKENPAVRLDEIMEAGTAVGVTPPLICVVPVRMTEAWFLFDDKAIRQAAGNPNGRVPLQIPKKHPDKVADPKSILHEALRRASGRSGRRLRTFDVRQAARRVADYIDDFSPLRELAAFGILEESLFKVLRDNHWT